MSEIQRHAMRKLLTPNFSSILSLCFCNLGENRPVFILSRGVPSPPPFPLLLEPVSPLDDCDEATSPGRKSFNDSADSEEGLRPSAKRRLQYDAPSIPPVNAAAASSAGFSIYNGSPFSVLSSLSLILYVLDYILLQ